MNVKDIKKIFKNELKIRLFMNKKILTYQFYFFNKMFKKKRVTKKAVEIA